MLKAGRRTLPGARWKINHFFWGRLTTQDTDFHWLDELTRIKKLVFIKYHKLTSLYLEAALTDQAFVYWSSTNVDVTDTRGFEIGTGKANTTAIIAAFSSGTTSNNAVKAAVAYTGGDKNDWFLPSSNELNEMYKARTHLGISPNSIYRYWSSSQSYLFQYAYFQDFFEGQRSDLQKNFNSHHVRAIWAF